MNDTASLSRPSPDVITPLILDLLAWLAPGPRPYAEVMEAWRTSCPRLPVWETAVEQDLVRRERPEAGGPALVALTPLGSERLDAAS